MPRANFFARQLTAPRARVFPFIYGGINLHPRCRRAEFEQNSREMRQRLAREKENPTAIQEVVKHEQDRAANPPTAAIALTGEECGTSSTRPQEKRPLIYPICSINSIGTSAVNRERETSVRIIM